MEFKHISVLLDETIEELHIKPDGIYVDGTLGGGGHAYHVCQKLSEKGRYIGIDQDADAIAASTKRLEPFKDKVTIVRDNYVNMPKVLHDLGIEHVDGILLDLGVSSFQLDEKERGFTYREDVPLDMSCLLYTSKVKTLVYKTVALCTSGSIFANVFLRFLFPKHIKIIQIYSSDFVAYMIIVFLLCAGMIGLKEKRT